MNDAALLLLNLLNVVLIGIALEFNRVRMKRTWRRELSVVSASVLVCVWQERRRWGAYVWLKLTEALVFGPWGLGNFDPETATPNVALLAALLGLGCLITLLLALIPTMSALLPMIEQPDRSAPADDRTE